MNKVHTIFKFLITEVIYNGHLQTIGAIAIAIFSAQIFKISISWDFLVVLYLLFYFIMLNDRYRDRNTDSLTNKIRTQHLKSLSRFITYILLFSSIILFLMLYLYSSISGIIIILSIMTLGILYPIYFKKLTRKIPLFKNLSISLVVIMIVLSPFFYYPNTFNQDSFYLVYFILIFSSSRAMMMQIFLDLKDIDIDKKENLKTLGVILGKERALKILGIMNVLTVLFLFTPYFINPNLIPESILPLILLVPFSFYYFHLARNGRFSGYILGSGEFIPWPLLIYLGELIK